MYYCDCEEPSIGRPHGPQTYQYNEKFNCKKKYKTHILETSMRLESLVELLSLLGIDSTIFFFFFFWSFMLPHVDLVLVPFEIELTLGRGPLSTRWASGREGVCSNWKRSKCWCNNLQKLFFLILEAHNISTTLGAWGGGEGVENARPGATAATTSWTIIEVKWGGEWLGFVIQLGTSGALPMPHECLSPPPLSPPHFLY